MADENSPKKKRSSPKDGKPRRAEQVLARNLAVESIYRRLIGLAFIATLAAIFSVVAVFALAGKKVPPQYVPVMEDGRLLPLIPLSKPNVNQAEIANFSLEAIRKLNTYDYINWVNQLNEAQFYFSSQGWKKYDEELQRVGTLKSVEARRMIVTVRPTGDVRPLKEGVTQSGVYVWLVEVPIRISYTAHVDQGGKGGNVQVGKVTLTISRVPTTENPRGISIQIYKFDVN